MHEDPWLVNQCQGTNKQNKRTTSLKLTNDGSVERCARNALGNHQEEHSEGQQNGNSEGNFLARVRRQAEHCHDEYGEERAWKDDVHDVEGVSTSEVERELDVWISSVWTTRKHVLLPFGFRPVDVPLAVEEEALGLDLVRGVCDVHPGAEVRPRAELDLAGLIVEWKVSDVDVACRREHPSWLPMDVPVVVHQHTDFAEIGGELVCSVIQKCHGCIETEYRLYSCGQYSGDLHRRNMSKLKFQCKTSCKRINVYDETVTKESYNVKLSLFMWRAR